MEVFLHVNILLCNLQGEHLHCDFTKWGKIVDLSKKKALSTQTKTMILTQQKCLLWFICLG